MRARALAGTMTALATTAAIAIPGAALGGARAARGHTVVLQNFRFHPPSLSINRGDTVTWLWRDKGISHNVTGSGFKSRTMANGSFTMRFSRRGTFNYRCTIHVSLGMRGKIVVH